VSPNFIRSPCTEVRESTGRPDAAEAARRKRKKATRDDGGDGCNRRRRGRQPYGLIQQRSPKIINLWACCGIIKRVPSSFPFGSGERGERETKRISVS